jgi:hypothetical protein
VVISIEQLPWQVPIKARMHVDPDLNFDANPLALRNGRLHIPQQLLGEYLEDEDTADAAAEFLADHAKEFLSESSEYTMDHLERAKQGMGGKTGVATSSDATSSACLEVKQLPEDPKDIVGLDVLPGVKWAVSACQRFRIYVCTIGVFVVPQVDLGVLPGEKVAEFGSGGFRSPGEIGALKEQVALAVHPVLSQDTDEVLLQGPDGKVTYLNFHGMMAKLLESGEAQWPVQVPFHNVTRSQARVKGQRSRFEITPTKEKSWVAISKKDGGGGKAPSWGNILKSVNDPAKLNNRTVKLVWQLKVHQLGVLRLDRPTLVWNAPQELTSGKVLRIA